MFEVFAQGAGAARYEPKRPRCLSTIGHTLEGFPPAKISCSLVLLRLTLSWFPEMLEIARQKASKSPRLATLTSLCYDNSTQERRKHGEN
jgi:hypothetical protein